MESYDNQLKTLETNYNNSIERLNYINAHPRIIDENNLKQYQAKKAEPNYRTPAWTLDIKNTQDPEEERQAEIRNKGITYSILKSTAAKINDARKEQAIQEKKAIKASKGSIFDFLKTKK